MRWKKNEASLSSLDDARILLPRLDKNLTKMSRKNRGFPLQLAEKRNQKQAQRI